MKLIILFQVHRCNSQKLMNMFRDGLNKSQPIHFSQSQSRVNQMMYQVPLQASTIHERGLIAVTSYVHVNNNFGAQNCLTWRGTDIANHQQAIRSRSNAKNYAGLNLFTAIISKALICMYFAAAKIKQYAWFLFRSGNLVSF